MPGRYDPRLAIGDADLRARALALPYREQAALAERLVGNIKVHAFYAVAAGTPIRIAEISEEAVPCLNGASAAAMAESIYKTGMIRGEFDGVGFQRRLPKDVAGILAALDGRRNLGEIRRMIGWEKPRFDEMFATLYQPLNNFGLLRFSRLKRFGSRR
jgi:hypothetical protein